MAVQFVFPGQQRVDANGNPLANHRLYFYEPGTTTPKDVFSDDTLQTPINQPVVADASGVWPRIYCAGKYKVVRSDVTGSAVETWDDFDPGLSTALGTSEALPIEAGGTNATTAAAARNNLGAASQASVSANTSDITTLETLVDTGLHSDGDRFGTAAKKDTGTSGNTVPLLDGTNTFDGENTFSNSAGILARNTVKAFAYFHVAGGDAVFTAGNYFNIASIERDSTGTFTVTFTTALPTANYVVVGQGNVATASYVLVPEITSRTTGGFTLTSRQPDIGSANAADPDQFFFAVFGF